MLAVVDADGLSTEATELSSSLMLVFVVVDEAIRTVPNVLTSHKFT